MSITRGLAVRGPDGRPSPHGRSASRTSPPQGGEKLQHDALHDDLTGLAKANRVLLIDRLSCALADFERAPKKSASPFSSSTSTASRTSTTASATPSATSS